MENDVVTARVKLVNSPAAIREGASIILRPQGRGRVSNVELDGKTVQEVSDYEIESVSIDCEGVPVLSAMRKLFDTSDAQNHIGEKKVNLEEALKTWMTWYRFEQKAMHFMGVSFMPEVSDDYRRGYKEGLRAAEARLGLLMLEQGVDLRPVSDAKSKEEKHTQGFKVIECRLSDSRGDQLVFGEIKHGESLEGMNYVVITDGELCDEGGCEWCDKLRRRITSSRVF